MIMVTQHVEIVLPQHVNANNRLFGGQLMAWIDIVAAVEARRHAHREVTTVSVDNLRFIRPAHLNDIVRMEARVTWTGRTSLEVRVDTFVESLTGETEQVNCAYLAFVALNEHGKPTPVQEFKPITDEERAEWARAEERRALRLRE